MKVEKAKGSEVEIEIPELEQAVLTYKPKNRPWSQKELALLYRYYNRVPIELLMKYLPERTKPAIKQKAESLMIHKREDIEPKDGLK